MRLQWPGAFSDAGRQRGSGGLRHDASQHTCGKAGGGRAAPNQRPAATLVPVTLVNHVGVPAKFHKALCLPDTRVVWATRCLGSPTPCRSTNRRSSERVDKCSAENDWRTGMALGTLILPRSDPGDALYFERNVSSWSVCLTAADCNSARLPYGPLPRLLLVWLATQAQDTSKITFGSEFFDFAALCGVNPHDRRLRHQLLRLLACAASAVKCNSPPKGAGVHGQNFVLVRAKSVSTWGPNRGWPIFVYLGEMLFELLVRHPLPIDVSSLSALSNSALALDLYLWFSHACFVNHGSVTISWHAAYELFSEQPVLDPTPEELRSFEAEALRELATVHAWPVLRYQVEQETLTVWPVRRR